MHSNFLLVISFFLLAALFLYSQNYSYSNAITTNINELGSVKTGNLVKVTGKIVHLKPALMCSSTCVYLNYYKGKKGVATIIGTLERKNSTTTTRINVIKSLQ